MQTRRMDRDSNARPIERAQRRVASEPSPANALTRGLATLMFVASIGAEACASETCEFEVDGLLRAAHADAPNRRDCGGFNAAQTVEVQQAAQCLLDAIDRNQAAELTVNRCIDCLIEETYVATTSGAVYVVHRQSDPYGNDTRVVSVASCQRFERDIEAGVACVAPQTLVSCMDHEV